MKKLEQTWRWYGPNEMSEEEVSMLTQNIIAGLPGGTTEALVGICSI